MRMRWIGILAPIWIFLAWGCGGDEAPDVDSVPEYPSYDEHIRPFLANHCILCHGERPRSGAPSHFRLDVYEDQDGKLGARSMATTMADVLEKGEMPPDGVGVGPNAKKMFRRWADLGAPKTACEPSCEGRACGDDGCGGSCGACEDGLSCSHGQCIAGCVPNCAGLTCGDDGCGGSCGTCEENFTCVDGHCFPEANAEVRLARVFADVIRDNCLACHGASESPLFGGTPQSFHAATVGVASSCRGEILVKPGDPNGSYLVQKIEGRQGICGARMPQGRPPLPFAKIALVKKWILDGALPD